MLPVLPVSVPEERDQVVFFKLNGQEDVGRRRDGKQQVALTHLGRGPKGDEEPEVDRVTNVLVKHGRLETNRLIRLTAQVKCDLPQAKKVSVTDHNRASQYGEPTKTEKGEKYPLAGTVPDFPHKSRHGPTLPPR